MARIGYSSRHSMHVARRFYETELKMPNLYRHAKLVYDCLHKYGLIEPIRKNDLVDDKRAFEVSLMSDLALFHVVDHAKLLTALNQRRSIPIPPISDNPALMEALRLFSKVTKSDWSGSTSSGIDSLKGHELKKYVLAVKMADYAVTHDTEDRLEDHVSLTNGSVIRTYKTTDEAYEVLRNETFAGERVYAPAAEDYGLPLLAGKIIEQSYRFTHPDIHSYVMQIIADETISERLALSRALMRDMVRRIKAYLSVDGFEAEIITRPRKHPGKLMRKVKRILEKDFKRAISWERLPGQEYEGKLSEHISRELPSFNTDRISDWLASTVVLDRYNGQDVDKMPPDIFQAVISKAIRIISAALDMQTLSTPALMIADDDAHGKSVHPPPFRPGFVEKPNGYRSYHYDLVLDKAADGSSCAMNMEVQAKTREWHVAATKGGAAHSGYIGGDRTVLESFREDCHDITVGNGCQPRTRRSSGVYTSVM